MLVYVMILYFTSLYVMLLYVMFLYVMLLYTILYQVVALDWVETLDASKLHMDQDEFLARMLEAGIDDATVFTGKQSQAAGANKGRVVLNV